MRARLRGGAVLDCGGQRAEDLDAGWDPSAAGCGRRGRAAMVAGRRAHGGAEAPVLGAGDPAEAGRGRPPGGARAHGGRRWSRGRRRITPRRPGPPEGHRCPARQGGHQAAVAGGGGAGAGGGGSAADPARPRGRWGRRGRWTGRHRPESRTLGKPWGHPCGTTRRLTSWAGRGMVCPRGSAASWERQQTGPAALARRRWVVSAIRWTARPRSCRTCARPGVVGGPETTPPLVQTTAGRVRSGRARRTRARHRPRQRVARAWTGTHGGRAGGPPLGPVGGDPPGGYQTVHLWMRDEGPGPGVEDAEHADAPPDSRWVRGARDARWGRGAAPHVGPVLRVAADQRPPCVGQGPDDRHVGAWEACLPPRGPPHRGVLRGARGTTPVAAGVGGLGRLTAVRTRPQRSAHGRGPAVEKIRHRAARAGQASRANPLLLGRTIVAADVRHRWHARAPAP